MASSRRLQNRRTGEHTCENFFGAPVLLPSRGVASAMIGSDL
jgi:hypothetical protein